MQASVFPNVQLLHNLRQKSKSGVYGKISKDSRYKNDVPWFEEIRLKVLSKQPFFLIKEKLSLL